MGARNELLIWIEATPTIRPFLFKNKPQMKEIAEDNNFNIPYTLRVDEYRQRLVNASHGATDGSGSTIEDSLQLALTKAMIGASFMKPLKRGKEEVQKKYSVLGQRLEKPMLKSLWKYLKNVKPDGQFDEDYQSLYQPGLIKKE